MKRCDVTGKVSYDSAHAAARALKLTKKSRFAGRKKMTHYRCQFCKLWHLGH